MSIDSVASAIATILVFGAASRIASAMLLSMRSSRLATTRRARPARIARHVPALVITPVADGTPSAISSAAFSVSGSTTNHGIPRTARRLPGPAATASYPHRST
jgi:hypothetical protein